MNLQKEFGARVRELRKRAELTQGELGIRCGGFVSQRIGEIERGEANCTLQTIAALSKGLRCDPIDLFLLRSAKADQLPAIANRRLLELWNAADERTKTKILRVLEEFLA